MVNHAVITRNAQRAAHTLSLAGRDAHACCCLAYPPGEDFVNQYRYSNWDYSNFLGTAQTTYEFFTPCFDTDFLVDNASFDSTFNHLPRKHDTFEEHASALSYFGRLGTTETYLDQLYHEDSIQNISRELHHAYWSVNNPLPSDFGRNPLGFGMTLEQVDSYRPGSQLLSTSAPESLTHPGNGPLVS